LATILGILLTIGPCFAQTPAADPRFEVASVKPAKPGPEGVWTDGSPIRIRMMNMSLKELIGYAYSLKDYQIFGPAWIDSENFDVFAKAPDDAAASPQKQQRRQMRAMTQSLLAERFKLVVHREQRPLPIYALVVAKGGAKIQELGPNPGDNVFAEIRRGHVAAQRMPMSQLVDILNHQVDRPIRDETEIKGVFDVKLDWWPESKDSNQDDVGLAAKPNLFEALQSQLGLKLELRKDPVEVLVVDHAERAPAEN
jgi:uncharacterized protein (TIGR03435 family)